MPSHILEGHNLNAGLQDLTPISPMMRDQVPFETAKAFG
jgi:hypothetical protein